MYNLSQFFQSTRTEGGRGVFFSEPFFLSLSDRRKRGGVKEGLAGPFFSFLFFFSLFLTKYIYQMKKSFSLLVVRCFLFFQGCLNLWGNGVGEIF